jgi:Domain of unknown function (DUF4157)
LHSRDTARTSDSGSAARVPAPNPPVHAPPLGAVSLLGLQRSVGNAAVVQMLRQAGHPWAQQQHQHGAGCGHQRTGQPDVQRSAVPDVLRSSGRPLDGATRTDMESRLGADFSDVRMHDDAAAKASAAEVGARAYTSGSHVVIGSGGGDRHTLAHELTHVIQQRQGPVSGTDNGNGLRVSDPSDRFEREAETNARRVMSSAAPVQRAESTTTPAEAAVAEASVQRMPKAKTSKPEGKGRDNPTAGKKRGAPALKEQLVAELVGAHGWQRFGAGQSLTLHRPEKDADGRTDIPGAKGGIYNGTSNVRGKKSYEGKRSLQGMRWLSNLAMHKLSGMNVRPEEVQATISGGVLYISANNNAANKKLRELVGEGRTGKQFAAKLAQAEGLDDRLERLRGKLKERIVDGRAEGAPTPENYDEIMSARVKVPEDVESESDGLHAERRLAAVPGFDAAKTIGVKRPCVVCFTQVYAELVGSGDLKVYPGPLWVSGAANRDVPGYEEKSVKDYAQELTQAVTAGGGTTITLSNDGKYTWDYNTDSDSDPGGVGALTSGVEGLNTDADAMETD